jgi:transposase-like protein
LSIRLSLVNRLPKVLARAGHATTAPPRRRGPGPRPVVSFKYQLRFRGRPSPIASAPAGDMRVREKESLMSAMYIQASLCYFLPWFHE